MTTNNSRIRAGIIGGAGYTGGEMIHLLLRHPFVDIGFVHSRSNAGLPICKVHDDLVGETDLVFAADIHQDIDVLFLCTGHGEGKAFLQAQLIDDRIKIIDLSQDFRLKKDEAQGDRTFVYGLPEYNRERIKLANNIANPGCFATAIQLGILPLAAAGILKEVHTSGITGATGAGQKLQPTSHFAWRLNNIEAYKSLTHQHLKEIMQTIGALQPTHQPLNFMPWRGDFARGIYTSSYTDTSLFIDEAYNIYETYYAGHPFTHVSKEMINLKQVVNTNKCLVHLELAEGKLVIHTAIDNLLKGASGQAVQNMNIMYGLPEEAGLQLKASTF